MEALSANMQRLALEATVSMSNLDNLKEQLKSIHEIVTRERSSIIKARDELRKQMLTKLGGNQNQLKEMDELLALLKEVDKHLALLKGVDGYRDRAHAHVVAVLHVLQVMEREVKELRERVAAPELVGDGITIDVHMKSIRSGNMKLKQRRRK